jgi:GH24 family phage-related lysozyme (muramidase)
VTSRTIREGAIPPVVKIEVVRIWIGGGGVELGGRQRRRVAEQAVHRWDAVTSPMGPRGEKEGRHMSV